MIKFKYYATLKNLESIQFDSNYFNSIKKIKEWARGRNGIYDLIIYYVSSDGTIEIVQGIYYIKNNRIYPYK